MALSGSEWLYSASVTPQPESSQTSAQLKTGTGHAGALINHTVETVADQYVVNKRSR